MLGRTRPFYPFPSIACLITPMKNLGSDTKNGCDDPSFHTYARDMTTRATTLTREIFTLLSFRMQRNGKQRNARMFHGLTRVLLNFLITLTISLTVT